MYSRGPHILVFTLLLLLSMPCLSQSNNTFALHAFGVQNSQLVIETDEDILVPSLSTTKISADVLLPIVPYSSSDPDLANAMVRELQGHPELTLGHSKVYFYLAVNQAFDRIYRNLALGQGMAGRSQEEQGMLNQLDQEYGSPGDPNYRAHLRALANIHPLRDKQLRLQVFFSIANFNRAAARIGLHSAGAFWDPQLNSIGYYFDADIFRWYKARASWHGQEKTEAALQVRDYVTRQSIDSIAHELIHIIQRSSGDFLGDRPFLAEAAALHVQANISLREEFARLSGEEVRRGGETFPGKDSPCLALMESIPPFFSSSLIRYYRGIEAVRKGLPLDRILLLPDAAFYSQPGDSLKAQYDAALAFGAFASGLPDGRFQKDVAPLLSSSSPPVPPDRLKLLAHDFQAWAEDKADTWWASASSGETYTKAERLTDTCLDQRHFSMAYMGTSVMFLLKPQSPTPFLYAGDIFFGVDIPFIAFDFYTLSNSFRMQYGPGDESDIRIDSRLGDAFEEIGDIQTAVDRYAQMRGLDLKNVPPGLAITLLRTKLKLDFYQSALSGGYAHEEKAFLLADSYVQQLQGGDCTDASDRQQHDAVVAAIEKGDIAGFEASLLAQYNAVLNEMHAERGTNKLDDIAKVRDKRCADAAPAKAPQN